MPEFSHFIPLVIFAFSNIMAPGPNNIIISTSCANYGFRRSIPTILGVGFGFLPMCFIVVIGLGSIFTDYPQVQLAFRWVSFGFVLYIGWLLLHARIDAGESSSSPPSLGKMMLFQWINPKTWAFAVVGTTFITGEGSVAIEALIITLIFWLTGLPCQLVWATSGAAIGRYLRERPQRLRMFNSLMVVMMVGAFIPILFQ